MCGLLLLLLPLSLEAAINLPVTSHSSAPSSFPWHAVTYTGCSDKRGHSSVYGYDDEDGMQLLFNFSWKLWRDHLCGNIFGAQGPGVEVQGSVVWTAMFGRTSFSSTSLLRIDVNAQTVTQSNWTSGSAMVFNIHFDTKRNVLIVALSEALTQTVQEFDPLTLEPGRLLGKFEEDGPQRMDGFYDRDTQRLIQVVEHNILYNYWMVLDCSSATEPAVLLSNEVFRGNTDPLALTFGKSKSGNNQLLAVYKGPDYTGEGEPVQVFHVDPSTGAWPASAQGSKTIAPRSQSLISLQAPLNSKRQQVLAFLGKSGGLLPDKCETVLIDFDTFETSRARDISCSQVDDSVWFSLSQPNTVKAVGSIVV